MPYVNHFTEPRRPISPTERERERQIQNAMAVIRRLKAGGPTTIHERKHAAVIRERLDRGDLVSDAQEYFMRLVEKIEGGPIRG